MTKPIKLPIHPLLGELHRHYSLTEWLVSAPIQIPYFNGRTASVILVDIEADSQPTEFYSAIEAFLAQPYNQCAEAEAQVFANYTDMGDAVGFEDLPAIETPSAVWDHTSDCAIYVFRNSWSDTAVYVAASFNCDWEEEHGLQLTFKEGKQLVKVGPQDGLRN